MPGNDFFQKMTKEAMEQLANGGQGWRAVESNVLLLACFGMLYNHLGSRLVRPLWFAACTIVAGLIWFIVSGVLGIN